MRAAIEALRRRGPDGFAAAALRIGACGNWERHLIYIRRLGHLASTEQHARGHNQRNPYFHRNPPDLIGFHG
jgi:hypothetical protein